MPPAYARRLILHRSTSEMADIKVKKSKLSTDGTPPKGKKKRAADPAEVQADGVALFAPEKKRKKQSVEGGSDTKKSKKKAKAPPPAVLSGETSTASDDTTLGDEPAPVDPMAVSNFNISPAVKAQLAAKGIHALFPIQAQTLDHCLAGLDLVGRAR